MASVVGSLCKKAQRWAGLNLGFVKCGRTKRKTNYCSTSCAKSSWSHNMKIFRRYTLGRRRLNKSKLWC